MAEVVWRKCTREGASPLVCQLRRAVVTATSDTQLVSERLERGRNPLGLVLGQVVARIVAGLAANAHRPLRPLLPHRRLAKIPVRAPQPQQRDLDPRAELQLVRPPRAGHLGGAAIVREWRGDSLTGVEDRGVVL